MENQKRIYCEECGAVVEEIQPNCLVCSECGTIHDVQYFACEDSSTMHTDVRNTAILHEQTELRSHGFYWGNTVMKDIFKFSKVANQVSNRTRMLFKGFEEISAITVALKLPRCILNESHKTYEKLTSMNEFKKKRRSVLCASIVYECARLRGFAYSEDNVCETTNNVTKKQMCVMNEYIHDVIGLPKLVCKNNVKDIIGMIGYKLKLTKDVIETAGRIAKETLPFDCCFKPTSLAAAYIWLAIDKTKNKSRCKQIISKTAGISITTLNKCSRYLVLRTESDMCTFCM